ncbi:Schlafen-like 1 [Mactra antiquata]
MGRKNRFNQGYNQQQFNQVNDLTVTSTYNQNVRQYYILGEHLGSEGRNLEFKAGPGFLHNGYRENVSKYICAFANSRENGKLLLGVLDNGEVHGYSCTHQDEDKIRRDTDEAMKVISPPIFPEYYAVRFVPVVDDYQNVCGNTKVIEICLNGNQLTTTEVLYSTKKGSYQRRDGGTHELTPYEIQEWVKQRYVGEIEKLEKNEQNLQSDLQSRLSINRQLEEKMSEKNEKLKQMQFENEKLSYEITQQKRENQQLLAEIQDVRHLSKSEQGNEEPTNCTYMEDNQRCCRIFMDGYDWAATRNQTDLIKHVY